MEKNCQLKSEKEILNKTYSDIYLKENDEEKNQNSSIGKASIKNIIKDLECFKQLYSELLEDSE